MAQIKCDATGVHTYFLPPYLTVLHPSLTLLNFHHVALLLSSRPLSRDPPSGRAYPNIDDVTYQSMTNDRTDPYPECPIYIPYQCVPYQSSLSLYALLIQ